MFIIIKNATSYAMATRHRVGLSLSLCKYLTVLQVPPTLLYVGFLDLPFSFFDYNARARSFLLMSHSIRTIYSRFQKKTKTKLTMNDASSDQGVMAYLQYSNARHGCFRQLFVAVAFVVTLQCTVRESDPKWRLIVLQKTKY